MNDTIDARGCPPGKLFGIYLATVISVQDDKKQGRVQLRLLGFDGVGAQNAPLWGRVAVPCAGAERGTFFMPKKGDEVVVQFVNGDPRAPIVMGGLWNGKDRPPETLGGEDVDRWTIVGERGTRIAIVEDERGPTISLATPNGQESVTVTSQGGGTIELRVGGSTVTIDNQSVSVNAGQVIKLKAGKVEVETGSLTVDAAQSQFSGMVRAQAVQSPSIMGATYTPGAGNVW